jgi:two-component system sensor histidine kinase/response regulator
LLQGDPNRLRQMMLNLIGNAIKFTDSGEIIVSVDGRREADGTIDLHFRVRDTGIGIPKDKQSLIFAAFDQADSSTSRRFGGTGLGLAVSSQLVALMGGDMWVESEPGRGSVFHFTGRFAGEEPAEPPTLAVPAGPRPPVVVGETNASARGIVTDILSELDMDWSDAATAAEVRDLERLNQSVVCKQPFDLAIIDFMMPNMDGEALGKAIKENVALAAMPMMLLTSRGLRGDAARAKKIGFDAYLQKPIRQSQLFNALLAALSRTPLPVDHKEPPPLITRHTLAEAHKQTLRILLVEDNRVNQKVALIHLRKFGYTATVANNGCEAVDAIRNQAYDMVLMDVQMPEMDGYAATRAIRGMAGDISRLPIIAMTANAMKGDREKCLEAGMDDYISKPIDPEKLQETIQQWAERQHMPHDRDPKPQHLGHSTLAMTERYSHRTPENSEKTV